MCVHTSYECGASEMLRGLQTDSCLLLLHFCFRIPQLLIRTGLSSPPAFPGSSRFVALSVESAGRREGRSQKQLDICRTGCSVALAAPVDRAS